MYLLLWLETNLIVEKYCRSSFEEFNPKPAQQNHLSHSLIDLLSQVNIITFLCNQFSVICELINFMWHGIFYICCLDAMSDLLDKSFFQAQFSKSAEEKVVYKSSICFCVKL